MRPSNMEKPLFIPLKAEHYDRFKSGEKLHEYRAYGARWNERTCRNGRAVILSRGYGKKNRMQGVVGETELLETPTAAFIEIYGKDKQCFAIRIRDLRSIAEPQK